VRTTLLFLACAHHTLVRNGERCTAAAANGAVLAHCVNILLPFLKLVAHWVK
jgi:hypothetical protein